VVLLFEKIAFTLILAANMPSLKGRLLLVFCAMIAALPAVFGQSSIRINEVLADNVSIIGGDNTITDWIELVNTSADPVDLSGATLSDNEIVTDKWYFPSGTIVPGNGYLLVKFDLEAAPSFDFEPYLNAGFNLSSEGDGVFIFALVRRSATSPLAALVASGNSALQRPRPPTPLFHSGRRTFSK
jgi:hypothetical protein